jgi:RimJ/RimL family protein N-acetyltransferase
MSWTTERRIHAVFRQAKEQPSGWRTALPVILNGHQVARLEPVTAIDREQYPLIDLLSRWRESAKESFPTQFQVTLEGTRNWLTEKVLNVPDRILYWIRGDSDGVRLGHLGLFHLDAVAKSIELDNVLRGVPRIAPGLMEAAVKTLLRWATEDLGLDDASLRVFADNTRAVRLYERCGFHVSREIPLVKLEEPGLTRWVEQSTHPGVRDERRFLEMHRRLGNEESPVVPRRAA